MKVRVISGIVAMLVGILILVFSDTFFFEIAITVVIFGCLYELWRAFKIECKIIKVLGYLLALNEILKSIYYIYGDGMGNFLEEKLHFYDPNTPFLINRILIIALIFLFLIIKHQTVKYTDPFLVVLSSLLITYSFCLFLTFKLNAFNQAQLNLLCLLLLGGVLLADSGAYFVGTLAGKTKLCPLVSPKKTVEGFVGGIITSAVALPVIYFVWLKIMSVKYDFDYKYNGEFCLHLITLGVICAVGGLIGDLTFSVIKRQVGIKDYGNLIPGHGGFLDRFDSTIFVAPLFLAYCELGNILTFH